MLSDIYRLHVRAHEGIKKFFLEISKLMFAAIKSMRPNLLSCVA